MPEVANRDEPPLQDQALAGLSPRTQTGLADTVSISLILVPDAQTTRGPYNGVVMTTKENPSPWTSVPAPDIPVANGP